ncbi:FecR family protein [uncultured Chitinophaga sp.]|jgi:Fe2+-dicitrate sensor, membrane component|uniref:FecR family protein n=1 Tax=uncultured Chitinophaga sp. TaxID=339340 RepID=UPI002633FBE8|nr:FecR family protein [uncultured Chitinophaga sp.]
MSQLNGHHEKLLQRYLDGQCSPEEVAELYAWLRTSEAHRPLLAAMQQEFEQVMQQPQQVPAALSDRVEARLMQDISRKKVRPLFSRYRVAAAAVILLAMAGGFWWLASVSRTAQQSLPAKEIAAVHKDNDVAPGTSKAMLTLADGSTVTLDSAGNQVIQQGKTLVQQSNGQLQYAAKGKGEAIGYNTLTVPRGGQFNIVLPDGSHVWLNAASTLRFPTAFTGKQRVVELQGQGYFEIKKDVARPFIVKVNTTEVQVLGTRFDIMAYDDEKSLNTTLLEGAVRMKQGLIQQQLAPGQQAVLDYNSGRMSVRAVDVDEVVAWKTGFFEFDNAAISVIMRQLSRWYDVEVSYLNNNSNRLFGGRISRNLPLSEILHMLEANGAKFNLEGRRLMVTVEN